MTLSRAQRQRIDRIAKGRSDESLFLLEGWRAVNDAIATGAVAEIWIRHDVGPEQRVALVAEARGHDIPVGEAGANDFERLAKTVTPQGVLALVKDTARDVADIAARPGLLLWLDGIQDPGNVGAVVRVGAAFGAAGLLFSGSGAHPLGLKALRASAGLALRVPFARAPAGAVAAALGGRPVWLLDRGGDDVFRVDQPPADLVLVVGSEGRGPAEEAREMASRTIGIPMKPGVDSLNAAVAAGIAVAAICRAVTGEP